MIKHLPDALMILGAGSASYGAWLLHPSTGFVVAGAFLLVAGVMTSRKAG